MCVLEQRFVMEALRQIGDRASDIDAGNAKEGLRCGGKKTDLERAIEEECGDVRAVEDILQVGGRGALLLQCFLKLGIQGRQLLVEGLKFLLRGLQLLVCRLKLLVDGKGFFIDGPQVFIGDLQIADDGVQLFARRIEFLFHLDSVRDVLRRRLCFKSTDGRLAVLDKTDKEHIVAGSGLSTDFHAKGLSLATESAARFQAGFPGLFRAFERRSEFGPKPLTRHDKDIPAGFARSDLQKPVDGSTIKQGFIFFIDQNRRRCVGLEKQLGCKIVQVDSGLP